jgi:hypothetical protein
MMNMGRLCAIMVFLAFVLLSFSTPNLWAVDTIIQGKVAGIQGGRVKIAYEGPYAPNVGDPIEIGFKIGDDFISVEGKWKIVEVGPEFVWAEAQRADGGEPAVDYLVVIHTMNPLQRSDLQPSTKQGGEVEGSQGQGSKPPEDGSVLIYDTFDDNRNGWRIWENGMYYDAYFKNGVYIIETKNELLSNEVIKPSFNLPQKFRLEVKSTWEKGIHNERYGLLFGVDANNYYLFGVSGNGQAVVGMTQEGVGLPNPINWQLNAANIGDGNTSNHLRLDVKDNDITYYVNDRKIGTIRNTMITANWIVGIAVAAQQQVAFDDLKFTIIE